MKLKILSFTISLILSSALFAENKKIDFDVLGPFPVPGTIEDKRDIDELLYLQKTRTEAQCAAAELESDSSIAAFFGGNNGLLSENEVRDMQKKLKWITIKTGAVVYLNKSNFNRNRPYINHSEIKPCIQLEGSKAYPSGHTTIARVYARIMGAIYPERAVLFLKRSDEVAQNRVIGGVHHPSDIVAGKILGDAIAEDYLETDDFVNEFSVY